MLELGISLTEQAQTPTFELDAILAVDDVANKVMQEKSEDAQRRR